jgi:hypothetical protein
MKNFIDGEARIGVVNETPMRIAVAAKLTPGRWMQVRLLLAGSSATGNDFW